MASSFSLYRDRTSEFRSFSETLKKAQGLAADPLPGKDAALSLETDPIASLSEFNRKASRIGLGIHETSQKIAKLSKFGKRSSMFDDPAMEIQELSAIIKNDITALNIAISDLQVLQNTESADINSSKDRVVHATTICDDLKSRLMGATKQFKDVLTARTENLKAHENRKQIFSTNTSRENPLIHQPNTVSEPPPWSNAATSLPFSVRRLAAESTSLHHPEMSMMQQVVPRQENYTQSRAVALQNLESTISELGGISTQLATMVAQQGELAIRIDDNMDDSLTNVEGACSALLKHTQISSNSVLRSEFAPTSRENPLTMAGSKIPSSSSASELGSTVVDDLEIVGRCQGSSTGRKRSRSQSAIKTVPSPAKRTPRRCSEAVVSSKGEIKLYLQQHCHDSKREPRVVSSLRTPREERSSDPYFQRSTWNPRDPAQIQALKKALHVASAPDNVGCREDEQKRILDFCKACIEQDKSGSLYVCGCPGTGKTLSVNKVNELLVLWAKEAGFQTPEVLSINCTLLTKASEIFGKVIEKFHPHLKNSSCSPLQNLQKLYSQKRQLSSGKMMMIIVDEMDYLRTRDHQVLNDIFMLSTLPYSQCILIGIANAIDLAHRFLPGLESLNCKPTVVTYCAYSKDQILKIIQQRLIVLGYDIFEPLALEFCARKVAAASGDMRKALDVCRSAIEVFEAELSHATNKEELNLVRFDHMDIALSRAFKPLIVDTIQSLPQHQQIILCSVVKFFWQCKKNATTLGELNRCYSEICKDNHIPPVGMLEFTNMCRALSDQGLLNVGQSKEIKQKRVTLQIDGSDVRFALKEIRFFSNCLES